MYGVPFHLMEYFRMCTPRATAEETAGARGAIAAAPAGTPGGALGGIRAAVRGGGPEGGPGERTALAQAAIVALPLAATVPHLPAGIVQHRPAAILQRPLSGIHLILLEGVPANQRGGMAVIRPVVIQAVVSAATLVAMGGFRYRPARSW